MVCGLPPYTRYDTALGYVFGYRFHKFEHYIYVGTLITPYDGIFVFDVRPNALCEASVHTFPREYANHLLFSERH